MSLHCTCVLTKLHLFSVSLHLFKFMWYDSIISHYIHLLHTQWLIFIRLHLWPSRCHNSASSWECHSSCSLLLKRNEWKAPHSDISTPPTQMIFLSYWSEWMQYVTERAGSYVPCVCDVSPSLRWEQVPSDILSVLFTGEVRGIAVCVSYWTLLWPKCARLPFLYFITAHQFLKSDTNTFQYFLAVSPPLHF